MGGKKKGSKHKEKGKGPGGGIGGKHGQAAAAAGGNAPPSRNGALTLMEVVDANPSHKVYLANSRQVKQMSDLAEPQLEALQWSARVGKPNNLDRYRIAAALGRAGIIQLFFEHSDWVSKEHASNPYGSESASIGQPPSDACQACNQAGFSCTLINHLLEILHAELGPSRSTARSLSFDTIEKIGGPVLAALVSQACTLIRLCLRRAYRR